MVEYTLELNSIFSSLADPTRRDILRRVAQGELSVGAIAQKYDMSFAAISKHLSILERAKLIDKRKEGKQNIVTLAPNSLKSADDYLEQYRRLWEQKFNKLDAVLKEDIT